MENQDPDAVYKELLDRIIATATTARRRLNDPESAPAFYEAVADLFDLCDLLKQADDDSAQTFCAVRWVFSPPKPKP